LIDHRIHGKNNPQMTQIFADTDFRRLFLRVRNNKTRLFIKNREPLKIQIVSHKADNELRRILMAKDTKIHEKRFLSAN
jgi:hypothetical protein